MLRTSRSVSLSSAILLGAVGLWAGPAEAGGRNPWKAPHGVYFDAAGGAEFVNLPELSAYRELLSTSPLGVTDDEFWLWTAEGALGFRDANGLALPDPIGQNARIELRVRYASGNSDSRDAAGSFSIISPDATVGFGGLIIGPPLRALVNSEFETWDADLTYQTDVVVNDTFGVSPFVGLTYTHMEFANDYKLPFFVETNDHTRTHYYGVALGTDLVVRPMEMIDVTLGLRADLMGAAASMDVDQDRGAIEVTESDDDQNFAARATASLGLGFTMGPFRLGVEGFARYLSYLAAPDHPLTLSDRSSNIDGEEMWSAGGSASLSIAF